VAKARIFVGKRFSRFAEGSGIDDTTLVEIATEVEMGLVEAHLGGCVYKKRVARPGQGKSAGFRTIIVFREGERLFIVYGFAKNERSTLKPKEEAAFKRLARELLEMTDADLADSVIRGSFRELARK
jgi:hypothetical protein